MNRSLDVNQVLEQSVLLVNNLLARSTSRFTLEPGKDLPLISGNQQQLEQVVINLLQNVCQALPDREKEIVLRSYSDPKQDAVVIEVADEGAGIPEADLSRVLNPFFTTRRSSGGTGLGLSVSANIVKEHGGRLEVQSREVSGSTFSVVLPLRSPEPP